jgi:hypothetical protein
MDATMGIKFRVLEMIFLPALTVLATMALGCLRRAYPTQTINGRDLRIGGSSSGRNKINAEGM